ncbi:MAG: c-type cytochrome [Candidatus Marinimicrobia bacterium]|nr:c-type cytochrome [Candidatus Neomarinimicrobiota bacterium]MBT3577109.1 c-type cytochrome [Candidatus Neomarinimicrobiota bacterium]MBT3679991.1 c-type cytochrome [Candidatus Neomarinimicrobiota bacterium]MBT3949614.1 c-type cytochrome [Candidatus Neomarinimicrobiota bacterium]MBT4253235.1 c-type cytochrome [Candidatus Neomarinimicrobiota bacterium]
MRVLLILMLMLSLISCSILLPIKVDRAGDINIISTPERLVRGEYLAEHVAGCTDCHSQRDWSIFMAPAKAGTHGAGGEVFNEEMGTPGTIYAPNITPAALDSWTDGEIVRAITSGVNKEGVPLFPIMPYPNYARMSQEDIYSIVVYLRTLRPIVNDVPKRKLNFPLSLIVRTIPKQAEFGTLPYKTDTVAYGKYMTTAAGCMDCHTPMKKGQPVAGMEFAGGFTMGMLSGGTVNSANITPHETGIKTWTREGFIQRFKALDFPAAREAPLSENQVNTPMPWTYYATMQAEDLGAIYDYLRSIPAIDNTVVKYPEL